ncbi:MAG: isocitrate lyase/phosphoenolpyruvate mutase family protein [Chloroflexi bacterium]|nr:isocitrate lyase/phosphoenolpyruvate mutase family protein [Chloroflexota bacterium]
MTPTPSADSATRADAFRALHVRGRPILIANAWDAGSARLFETCGAAAIATTSAGLAWARGYPDGNAIPPAVLAEAVAEIVRVVSVPVSVDAEGGYSDDPATVAENVRAIIDAGGIGINIEDGSASPDLLVAKIEAIRAAAATAGVSLFVNARTDVYLRGLVPAEEAIAESLARGARYADAGADGLFVPGVADPEAIRAIAAGSSLPVNVLVVADLPPVAKLAALGVARISAGSGIAQAAAGIARRAALQFLDEGHYETMLERDADYGTLNALFG